MLSLNEILKLIAHRKTFGLRELSVKTSKVNKFDPVKDRYQYMARETLPLVNEKIILDLMLAGYYVTPIKSAVYGDCYAITW